MYYKEINSLILNYHPHFEINYTESRSVNANFKKIDAYEGYTIIVPCKALHSI